MKRGGARLLKLTGYGTCIGAPMAAVIDQYGYLIGEQGTSWTDLLPCSVLVLPMILLCFKPVLNRVMRLMKSDASWKMWLIVTIIGGIGVLVGKSMFIIGAFGLGGNVIGHFMIKGADASLLRPKD